MLLLLLKATKKAKGLFGQKKGCLRLVIKKRYRKRYKEVYTLKED
jgi:hypothetical protein